MNANLAEGDSKIDLADVQSMIRSGDFGEIMEKSGKAEDDLEGLKESLEIRQIKFELGEMKKRHKVAEDKKLGSFSERINEKHDFLMKHETLLFKRKASNYRSSWIPHLYYRKHPSFF